MHDKSTVTLYTLYAQCFPTIIECRRSRDPIDGLSESERELFERTKELSDQLLVFTMVTIRISSDKGIHQQWAFDG